MAVLATDAFTGVDGTSPTSANWATTSGLNAVHIISNQATNTGGGNSGQRYTAVSPPADQYVKCTIVKTIATADQGPGPAARIAAGATTFYFGQANTTDTRLYKVVANVFTQLGSTAGASAVNDVLELDCVGTSITLKKNGTIIVGPITDSAIASGNGGLWIGGVSADDCALDTWELGDFSGSTSSQPRLPDNPRIATQPITNRTHLEGVKLNLIGKDQFFTSAGRGPNYDWPNPRIKPFPVEDRGYVDPSETWNWGKDKFFAAPGQAPVYDYPNPRLRPFPIDGRTSTNTVNNTLLTAIAAPQAPFSTTDWPNPNRRTTPIESRTLLSWFMVDDTVPFAPQAIWPNPERRGFPLENRTQADGTELDTLAPITARPFSTTDWPNPGFRVFPVEDRTQADPSEFWLLKDTFFGVAGQPPTYLAQPNPRIANVPTDARTWTQALLQSTLRTLTPISLSDWPNPRGYRYPISLRTAAEFTRLLGKDKFFGAAGQPITIWPQPNPLGYRYPLDLRTGFARQTLTSSVAAMDAACIIRVGAEPWIFTVPADPEGIIVSAELRVVTDVDAEPQSAFIDTSWIQIGWTE